MGCENQNTSSLSVPKNLTVKNGIISFEQVSDADFYSISINDKVFSVDAKYNSNVNIVDNVINYDANKLFSYGKTYSIKIKARGDEKYDSHYTAVVTYLHNIDLLAPQNVKISAKTLLWDNVNDATYYIVKAFHKTNNRTKEFRCDINMCDISGFLLDDNTKENLTGEYQFSVKALREGNNPAESIYSDVVNYTNYEQLSTPIINSVYESGNDIMMSATIDENANKITINCGSDLRNVMLNGTSQYVLKTGANVTLNLTGIFGVDEFVELKAYIFTLQAKIETNSTTYFTNSLMSEQATFNKTIKLKTPSLTKLFSETLNKYVISWEAIENATGYYVVINGGAPIYVENTQTQFVIDDFTNIKVMAIGAGNYLNSNYSSIVTK